MAAKIRVELNRHRADRPWNYADLDRRQREISADVRDQSAPGVLLISELAPVITLGRRAAQSELLWSPERLAERGVSVLETSRGGLATWHGPGQWVVFAVDRLGSLTGDPRGVRRAVEGLLSVALDVSRHFEPLAEIREGRELGVWSPRGKLASVGVQIEQGVLLHGLSLNGYATELSFLGLRPCGLDAQVDFLLPKPDEQRFLEIQSRLEKAVFARFWNLPR